MVARLSGGTAAVTFPFLALLVSGGHNQLILARGIGEYTILGSTLVRHAVPTRSFCLFLPPRHFSFKTKKTADLNEGKEAEEKH